MQAHREKGICYNCDEKFSRGHRCVQQKIYLLDVDSPLASEIGEEVSDTMDDPVDTQELPTDPPYQDDQPEISLHALAGVTSPQTMRVRG